MNRILKFFLRNYPGDHKYWNQRYRSGGNSGSGSYNRLAAFKIETINEFIKTEGISSIIDFGCGDGNQIEKLEVKKYRGLDISQKAIEICKSKFYNRKGFSFTVYNPAEFDTNDNLYSCALSLDVLFHITEDSVYEKYLSHLFSSASRFVVIYSRSKVLEESQHVKDRAFQVDIFNKYSSWQLYKSIPNRYPFETNNPDNTSRSDFYIFKKTT